MDKISNTKNRVLIIPAAGKSTRFPNMRPKWMLTHPDGMTMIEKVVKNTRLGYFDKTYIVVLKEHCDKYNADVFLDQAFKGYTDLEFIVIDKSNSPAETVFKAIEEAELSSDTLITIKDSDGLVDIDYYQTQPFIAGMTIDSESNVRNIQNKSFIQATDSGYVEDIVEKEIISDKICVGVYCTYAGSFKMSFMDLSRFRGDQEIYVSEVMIFDHIPYNYLEAKSLTDWGTLEEWEKEKDKYKTYFVDIDGVIVKNHAKYGIKNWNNTTEFLEDNVKKLLELQNNGAKLVLTSSRPEKSIKELIKKMREEYGFRHIDFVANCTHAHRVVVNDFAKSNKYPSCSAVSIPRDGNLKDYL